MYINIAITTYIYHYYVYIDRYYVYIYNSLKRYGSRRPNGQAATTHSRWTTKNTARLKKAQRPNWNNKNCVDKEAFGKQRFANGSDVLRLVLSDTYVDSMTWRVPNSAALRTCHLLTHLSSQSDTQFCRAVMPRNWCKEWQSQKQRTFPSRALLLKRQQQTLQQQSRETKP